MQALLDTNVVLDLLLKRAPFEVEALAIWNANRAGQFKGYVSAVTPITVFYVARKSHGADYARNLVREVLKSFLICSLEADILSVAYQLPLTDYEDAAQLASALAYGLDAIVTRDPADFAGASIPVLSPADFLSQLPTVSDTE